MLFSFTKGISSSTMPAFWCICGHKHAHRHTHLGYQHNKVGDYAFTHKRTQENTHTHLYQQSPVCTICSNKRQWVFSETAEQRSDHQGFLQNLSTSSLVTQMLHSEKAGLIGWWRMSGTWSPFPLRRSEKNDVEGGGGRGLFTNAI